MVWALGIVKQEEAFFFSLWDMKRKKTLQTITTYFKMYWETWGGKEMRQDFCKEGCSQTICTAQCEMHTGLLMSAGCKSVPHPLPPATPNWVCIQIVQVVFASESSQKKRRATAVCAHQGGQSVLQCQLWHCQTQDRLSCLSLNCGLVVLWLQFTEQDGSTRQDKNKVKCSQGYTADLGKLLQLKLICCFTPVCHLCIKVPLGYRTML